MKTDSSLNSNARKSPEEANGYVVPEGYFESLKQRVEEHTTAKKPVSLISNSKFRFVAAAASIVLITGVSFLLFNRDRVEAPTAIGIALNGDTQKSLSMVPNDSIKNNATLETITPTNAQTTIDNEILEVSEELDLTDEELIDLLSDVEI